jgi:CRISPR/Cas system CSM-associated protein Csm3 (group 7 of RAMP superfamily)
LFGSLAMRGRCAIRDLFPFARATSLTDDDRRNLARANQVEVRHGVFIGRISGSVEVGPFDQEMVPAGTILHGEVALQNYQAWQLGLVCSAFDELTEGFAQLGSSKTRGLGVVRVDLQSLVHEQRIGARRKPLGAGDLVDDATRRAYGLFAESPLPESEGFTRGLSHRFEVEGQASIARWAEAGIQALTALHSAARGAA